MSSIVITEDKINLPPYHCVVISNNQLNTQIDQYLRSFFDEEIKIFFFTEQTFDAKKIDDLLSCYLRKCLFVDDKIHDEIVNHIPCYKNIILQSFSFRELEIEGSSFCFHISETLISEEENYMILGEKIAEGRMVIEDNPVYSVFGKNLKFDLSGYKFPVIGVENRKSFKENIIPTDISGVDVHEHLKKLSTEIKNNPFLDPHLLSLGEDSGTNFCQFYVREGHLDCKLEINNVEFGNELVTSIAATSVILFVLSKLCDLKPGTLIISMGCVYIHEENFKTFFQMLEEPIVEFPTISLDFTENGELEIIFDKK